MPEKVNVLLDLNIDGDCTNLAALACLNALANQGYANMLATTACFDSPLATGCIKAINRYYGNPDVPVGILHCQPATHPTNFLEPVNKAFCPDHPDGEDVEDTVRVLRRALAGAEDESVVFVVVGCFASAAELMKSGPDDISPLTGQELCDTKITRLVSMSGCFPTFAPVFGENNVIVQVPAAQYVTEHWTKPLTMSGWEMGWRIRSGLPMRRYAPDDVPMKMMYTLLDEMYPAGEYDTMGNPSWDQTCVLEAIFPGKYFYYHTPGLIRVDGRGVTHWCPDTTGKMDYLLPKVPFEEVANAVDDLLFADSPKYRSLYDGIKKPL